MKQFIVIILLLGLVTLFSGCKAEEKAPESDIISLGSQPNEQAVEAYGVIKATETKNVTIDFPAKLIEIQVENGQLVSKGDTLMLLNIDDYMGQLKEKECDLNLLKEQNKEAEQQLKQSNTANQSTEKNKMIQLQNEKLKVLEDNLQLSQDKLQQETLKQNEVINDLDYAIVYNVGVSQGDFIGAGSSLLTLADISSVIVEANIDQQFISWVEDGAKVDVIPEYDKSRVYKGNVSFISSKAFQINGETVIPVQIKLNNIPEGMILDSDVQVKIYPIEQKTK